VNLVGPTAAVLGGLCLFFVPGLVLLALLPRRDREALPLDEALFLMVATSVCASSWMALVLAEAGRFSLVWAAGVIAGLALVALWIGRRRLGGPLPPAGGARRALLPALAVLAVSLFFQARPGEYMMGGRDPGTYIAAMALIGRTGGVAYVDPVVQSIPPADVELFFRNPGNPDYSWGRFMGFPLERPETARVVPEFFHLFPAFGAYLFQSMGVKGALATPCVFGVLGTLAVFFAWRRVFGPAPALLLGLLLAVNVVQVWFARYPVSEPMSQFLTFLGLFAFAHWEERGSGAFGALAGIAFGLSLLVRIDSVLLVLPLGLYVLVQRAHGGLPWPQLRAFAIPFVILGGHAFLHAAFWSRKYLLSIYSRPYWNQPPWVWLALAAAVVVLILLAHRTEPRVLAFAQRHGPLLRSLAMGLVLVLAGYMYFLRPWLSAWAGGDGNEAARTLSNPWVLHRLGFRRLAAHDAQSFLRLGWFVSPLGLLLGVVGLVSVIRHWQRRYFLTVAVALTFAGFYLYKIRIYNDYYFAMRRFLPVILPVLVGLAAVLLCRLAARGGRARLAAGLLTIALLGLFLRDSIPLLRHRDWPGSVSFVAGLARQFGPEDVVIFEQPQSIHLLALPLWAVHGVNVVELARFDPDPAKLQDLVDQWRTRYRNIYFVHTYRTDLCGIFLQRVRPHLLVTHEWELTYDRPPREPVPRSFRFAVSRVVPPEELAVPALPEVDIGGSDDFQVSGFFDKEEEGARSYRWTGGCASLYVPGARGARSVSITASAGRRPQSARPAVVTARLGGTLLGQFTAGPGWQQHVFPLPHEMAPGPPVLRLDVAPWRPVNLERGSEDVRDLGVMVDRVRVE
jgi:hypothetical protein